MSMYSRDEQLVALKDAIEILEFQCQHGISAVTCELSKVDGFIDMHRKAGDLFDDIKSFWHELADKCGGICSGHLPNESVLPPEETASKGGVS